MKVQTRVFSSLLALGALLGACSGDQTATPAPQAPPDTALPGGDVLTRALEAAPAEADRSSAAIAPQERARVGTVAPSAVGGRDLGQSVVGKEGTFSFDMEQDGQPVEVYVFTAQLEPITYLLWSRDGQCKLAWQDGASSWGVSAACDGPEDKTAIICQDASCARCDAAGACEGCAATSAALTQVRCQEPVMDSPDMGMDTDEDLFVPDRPGECNLECVSQRGAYCCTTCGCEGEIKCQPECRTGYRWDCEVGCCFSYETYSCDCPQGTRWSPSDYACQ